MRYRINLCPSGQLIFLIFDDLHNESFSDNGCPSCPDISQRTQERTRGYIIINDKIMQKK